MTYGATSEDWAHFDLVLGLGEELLPTVCDPSVERSPLSKVQHGRTPSLINRDGQMAGIKGWTQIKANGELKRWSQDVRLGICMQTRIVRGIDVDVPDADKAQRIADAITRILGMKLPVRRRQNTGKRLLAVTVKGDIPKKTLKVGGTDQIEFLGNGQMFVAAGARKDGSRYYWEGGLPTEIPEITVEQYDHLIAMLTLEFGVEPVKEGSSSQRHKGEDLDIDDPVADWLQEQGLVLGETHSGALMVECPWNDEHTSGEPADSSTVWFPAGTKGHTEGHFKCMHGHCEGRNRSDFLAAVEFPDNRADDFDVVEDTPGEKAEKAKTASRFQVIPAAEFARRPPPEWIVKNVLPDADLAMLFGESGSGKSFIMIDIAMAIARGVPWRGMKVRQGRVVYIAAEGGGGFRNRLLAYAQQHQIKLEDIPFGVIHAAPNFLEKGDAKAVAVAIKAGGPVALIIVDTYAQVTPGANENSAEDMGMALKNARVIKDETGGMMLLVHHAGKDSSKGARGWSGNHAAADAVLEVTRNGNQRALRTAKQKDGDDGAAWGFSLETVVVGMDQDGDVIDSCIAVEAAVGPKTDGKKEKPVSFGEWEELILETYAELALSGEGVMLTDLTTGAAAKREKPVSSKVRKASALRAVKNLCEAGPKRRFKMVEDVVFELVV